MTDQKSILEELDILCQKLKMAINIRQRMIEVIKAEIKKFR